MEGYMITDLYDMTPNTPQAITAAAYSSVSKDKGLAALDYAAGETVYGVAQVTTTFQDAGGNTGTQVYWTDDTAGTSLGTTFGTGTPADLQLLGTFPKGAVVGAATSRIQTPLAPGLTTQQNMGFHFVPLGANLTAGKVIAGFTTDPEAWFAYATSYTVQG
jgi:hypothetical protein